LTLAVERVSKRFDQVVAVDDLSFSIPEGVIFGFLGPNGAGKTTTMRMMLDIIRPDSGRITWQGRPIGEKERRRIGYLPEERGMYQKMKVREQLVFFGRLYGLAAHAAAREVGEALERFDLAERGDSRLEELSKGNQQKVQLIAALLHGPDLALLDEPFSGLDPLNTEMFEERLRELKAAGKTVVLSSHQMDQVEDLCDEIAIISRGSLRLAGNVDKIRDKAVRRVVDVRTASGGVSGVDALGLSPLPPGRDYLRFALEPATDPQAVLAGLVKREQVDFFALERPSLQEIFVAAVQGADEEGGAGEGDEEWGARDRADGARERADGERADGPPAGRR
jgi:ABC-2 type transport system ATP-binding protein